MKKLREIAQILSLVIAVFTLWGCDPDPDSEGHVDELEYTDDQRDMGLAPPPADPEQPEYEVSLGDELSPVACRPTADGYEIISADSQTRVTAQSVELDDAMASQAVLAPEGEVDPHLACYRCSFCACALGHCVCYGCVPIECQIK